MAGTGGWGPGRYSPARPAKLHTIGLICFGIALHQHGWRVAYLGAATPSDMLKIAAPRLRPELITVCTYFPGHLEPEVELRQELAGEWRLALAGPGAGHELGERCHAEHLAGDPVAAAAVVAVGAPTPR